ncbi:MAG: type II toxin-antitoxin system VapC family toxin [Actinomycetota bacterium]
MSTRTNGVRVALDTTIAIHLLNGHGKAQTRFAAEPGVAISAVVAGELLFGAGNSRRKVVNTGQYERFIRGAVLLPISFVTAQHYAALRLALKQAGKPIPENDLWIAAACLEHGLTLATADAHFSNCPTLSVENWIQQDE